MKSLKTILLLAAMLLLGGTLTAQVDYMRQARLFLSEGNCKGARKYYEMALQCQLNEKRDAQFEKKLAECESGKRTPTVEDFTCKVNGVPFVMKYVEGGTFRMGGDDAKNRPKHDVKLSGFYICETEVTQELWMAVMDNNPSRFNGDNLPVETVNMNDCQLFIRELNRKTGKNFRLPTEAEWEYAARGGKKSNGYTYAGSNSIDKVAVYEDNSYNKGKGNPDYGTHRVKSKSPNELGLFDMTGNVFEWCSDWYGEYDNGTQTNPQGPSTGLNRVVRGGDWASEKERCQVSYRGSASPDVESFSLGFRICLSL